MTTCYATIAALGSHSAPVTEEHVFDLTRLTPRERLLSIPARVPATQDRVREVLANYAWFLEMTGLPSDELQGHFADNEKRTQMFQKANEYGDSMYRLLQEVDAVSGNEGSLLRYLVI